MTFGTLEDRIGAVSAPPALISSRAANAGPILERPTHKEL